ncbi:MAG: transglutaminaseTgpA domain-containing protein [Acidimicrobiales bacterium]
MTLRPSFTTSLSIAVMVAVAALPLREAFGDWDWAFSVLGAALAAALVASVLESAESRPSGTAAALAAVLGSLVWAVTVSMRGIFWTDPVSWAVGRELGEGVFSGWEALLDEEFPLTDRQSAETFTAILTWIAVALGVHVAARHRTVLAGVAGAAAVLWVSTTAALPRDLTSAMVGIGVGGLALLAIATTTRSSKQHWRPGRAGSLLLVIAGSAGLAMVAATVAGLVDREPVDPRAARTTETVTEVVPDILAEFGISVTDDRVVLRLDGPPITSPLRLRLQVYDTHNGERWLPATDYEDVATFPTPEILPPGEIVNYAVELESSTGPWIPLPDRLISLDINDILWNEQAQTALETTSVDTYEFTGTSVDRTELEGLEADRNAVSGTFSQTPSALPEEIRAAAEAAALGSTDAISTINAISARVRELERNESRPPGNSFGRLRADLVDGRATGAEQIASLHALMLRAVGIPSRLVVGYVATGPVVESSDLHVWTEAALPGVGWVASDPVPPVPDVAPDVADDATVTTTSLVENPVVRAQALPRELGPGEDPDETSIGGDDDITLRDTVVYAAIAIAVLLAVLIVVRVARRQFRHATNRRAASRVLGAWAEFVDRLRELGATITATSTIGDVVATARSMDDELGDEAHLLGELAARALHGPTDPTVDDGTLAWEELRRVESTLREVKGGYTVILRLIDPRVLRYRPPRPPRSRQGRQPVGFLRSR